MKNIIVVGLGITGVGIVDFFKSQNVMITAYDNRKNLKNMEEDYANYPNVDLKLGKAPTGDEKVDAVYISPSISMEQDYIKKFQKNGVKVWGELELAYENLTTGDFIGITGTNGKTTTTSLVGTIYDKYYQDISYTVGNIGKSIILAVDKSQGKGKYICEISSFQLESIDKFRPHIAAILNIEQDHLNRHKTMEVYKKEKYKIFKNQKPTDYLILNKDDLNLDMDKSCVKSKILYFSMSEIEEDGIFYNGQDGYIYLKIDNKKTKVMPKDDILLIGSHNIQNVMASILICYLDKIPLDIIVSVVSKFKAIPHRMQLVDIIDDVKYINDSKATNPASVIVAIQGYEKDVILIAGGSEKDTSYTNLVKMIKDKVKKLVLFGKTKYDIAKQCDKEDFKDYVILEDLENCVKYSQKIAKKGDTVLLSPACASFDMYDNFEKRGEHFIEIVKGIRKSS